jgi:hypothetical protein
MKSVLYSVVVVFLAGGAVCTGPKPKVEPAPQPKSDASQFVDARPGAPTIAAPAPEDTKAEEKKPDGQNTDGPSYSRDLKPFLAKYCVECHNANTAKAGFNLDGFEALKKGGRKGPAVVPGEPGRSMVVRVLSGQGKRMPPAKYTHQPKADDVEALKAWIAAGAKDDAEKSSE